MWNDRSVSFSEPLVELPPNDLDTMPLTSGLSNLRKRHRRHVPLHFYQLVTHSEVRGICANRGAYVDWLIFKRDAEPMKYAGNVCFPSRAAIEAKVKADARYANARPRINNVTLECTRNRLALSQAHGVPFAGRRHPLACFCGHRARRKSSPRSNYLRWNPSLPRMKTIDPCPPAFRGTDRAGMREFTSREVVSAFYASAGHQNVPILCSVSSLDGEAGCPCCSHSYIIPRRILQQRRDPAAFDPRLRLESVLAMEKQP